jgi:hypothetical protein
VHELPADAARLAVAVAGDAMADMPDAAPISGPSDRKC